LRSLKFAFPGNKRQWVFPKVRPTGNGERGRPACLVSATFRRLRAKKNRREDVKNPKNHFRPFYSGNQLSSKPFQPESHKTIFRIFREIFEGYRGEGVADFISSALPRQVQPGVVPVSPALFKLSALFFKPTQGDSKRFEPKKKNIFLCLAS
jgi:hypothetical protein